MSPYIVSWLTRRTMRLKSLHWTLTMKLWLQKLRPLESGGQYKVVLHETQIVLIATTVFRKQSSYPHLNRVDILMGNEMRVMSHIVDKCCRSFLFFIGGSFVFARILFSNLQDPVKILPPSSRQLNEAEVLRTARRVTIDELAFLDPDLHKDDTFLCKASVKRFDTRYNWWYSACPNCVKQMHKDPTTEQLTCQKHPNQIPTSCTLIIGKSGEQLFGMVADQQLPNEFLRMIGQKKIFHLRFGNRRNNFNLNDVLIYNVSEDTSMEPMTPQTLPKEMTVSSTTVSSSTSTPETSGQSYKRKRESVRRALFIVGEQSEPEEISEVDPKELDEVPSTLFTSHASVYFFPKAFLALKPHL
ncbi:hypothetical protein DVH24_039205 [Malus domestica]|uniref:Replication factor A C-terminal domain-containing protein n=1 Tax=Malus domestica TaxID=3750 RepID=A0A498KBY5_MALDO|nr:hypothetical protein DVH24_039205 [Malus domestica]